MHVTSQIAEAIAPRRLGSGFRWLLSATIVNNIGDGVVVSAGPLLVASLTHDPFLVSMALFFEYLPTLLFGVLGGVAADRFDRRQMVIVVNLARAGVLAVLCVTIANGSVSIALVLAALFVMGTAETLADSATSTLLPGLVAREDLGIANARNAGWLAAHEPAPVPADRGVPVRRRTGDPIRHERGVLPPWRGPHFPPRQ